MATFTTLTSCCEASKYFSGRYYGMLSYFTGTIRTTIFYFFLECGAMNAFGLRLIIQLKNQLTSLPKTSCLFCDIRSGLSDAWEQVNMRRSIKKGLRMKEQQRTEGNKRAWFERLKGVSHYLIVWPLRTLRGEGDREREKKEREKERERSP